MNHIIVDFGVFRLIHNQNILRCLMDLMEVLSVMGDHVWRVAWLQGFPEKSSTLRPRELRKHSKSHEPS